MKIRLPQFIRRSLPMITASLLLSAGWALAHPMPGSNWQSIVDGILGRLEWQGVIVIPASALILEMCLVGWQSCSIRRLVSAECSSASMDWQSGLLILFGGMGVAAGLSTGGLLDLIGLPADGNYALLPMSEVPALPRWLLLFLAGNFIGYWEHRAMHSHWLWTLHKVHHSATEFTIANSFRAHPFEFTAQALTSMLGLHLLGFPGGDIALYGAVGAGFTAYVHSNAYGTRWLESLGVMTPAGHRLHHGLHSCHHNCNFGDMLNLGDRLFGSYRRPDDNANTVEIGSDDSGRFGNPLTEIGVQSWCWMRARLRWQSIRPDRHALAGTPRQGPFS